MTFLSHDLLLLQKNWANPHAFPVQQLELLISCHPSFQPPPLGSPLCGFPPCLHIIQE